MRIRDIVDVNFQRFVAALVGTMGVWLALCVVPGGFVAPAEAQIRFPDRPASTFRRVPAVTGAHDGPRITIQIEPREPGAAPYPDPNRVPDVTAEPERPLEPDSASAWFWSVVSPQIGVPGRYDQAIAHLSEAPETRDLRLPRFEDLTAIVQAHGREILASTAGSDVSAAFVLAVIAVESAGRVEVVSHAGAQGLMQLIPATAERFGVGDPFDPGQNIAGGAAYLSWLMENFNGDPVLALAGYNAGEGAVARAGGVPNYDETRDYVPKVLATWLMARQLCTRRPDLVSDPCLFTTLVSG
ncbi:MAG: lytic transglycosylase domain-containing protein [Pseudomonadota bacterium]